MRSGFILGAHCQQWSAAGGHVIFGCALGERKPIQSRSRPWQPVQRLSPAPEGRQQAHPTAQPRRTMAASGIRRGWGPGRRKPVCSPFSQSLGLHRPARISWCTQPRPAYRHSIRPTTAQHTLLLSRRPAWLLRVGCVFDWVCCSLVLGLCLGSSLVDFLFRSCLWSWPVPVDVPVPLWSCCAQLQSIVRLRVSPPTASSLSSNLTPAIYSTSLSSVSEILLSSARRRIPHLSYFLLARFLLHLASYSYPPHLTSH